MHLRIEGSDAEAFRRSYSAIEASARSFLTDLTAKAYGRFAAQQTVDVSRPWVERLSHFLGWQAAQRSGLTYFSRAWVAQQACE